MKRGWGCFPFLSRMRPPSGRLTSRHLRNGMVGPRWNGRESCMSAVLRDVPQRIQQTTTSSMPVWKRSMGLPRGPSRCMSVRRWRYRRTKNSRPTSCMWPRPDYPLDSRRPAPSTRPPSPPSMTRTQRRCASSSQKWRLCSGRSSERGKSWNTDRRWPTPAGTLRTGSTGTSLRWRRGTRRAFVRCSGSKEAYRPPSRRSITTPLR
mmetsp:Transcript_29587/g.58632  ORF Transcript_29587/g.58632 Transcript_29587/m.58632 type:complete len:206 (+) Transcript_29587:456-1073(+)